MNALTVSRWKHLMASLAIVAGGAAITGCHSSDANTTASQDSRMNNSTSSSYNGGSAYSPSNNSTPATAPSAGADNSTIGNGAFGQPPP